jgi:L1 cell adhesion molecule like protein
MIKADKSETVKDILLHDVAHLSFGIETAGVIMIVLIARNAIVRAKTSHICTESFANQPGVTIKVTLSPAGVTANCQLSITDRSGT